MSFLRISRKGLLITSVLFLVLLPLVVLAAALTFTEHQVGNTSYDQVRAMEAIDLDEDGDTDIVSVSDALDDLTWWDNNGSETFTQRTIDGSIDSIYDVKVIDLDQDGDRDILAGAPNSVTQTMWYENNGSESFTLHLIETVNRVTCLDAADMDGDLDIDIVGCDYGEKIVWLKNNGSESFSEINVSTSNTTPLDVKAVDLDGDGDTDVVSTWQTGNRLFWHRNSGTGSFTTLTIDSSITTPYYLDTGDIDDDGDMDVVVASYSQNNVYWYANDGSENFTENTVGSLTSAEGVWIGDIDGDGDKDIAATGYSASTVLWFDNNGSESFTSRTINASFEQAGRVQVIDIDGDADNDVVTAGLTNNYDNVTWWENAGATAPSVSTLSPVDNAYNISTTANLVITFDQTVQGGTGSITIKKSSGGTIIETISGNDVGFVSGSGTTVITINPAATLLTNTGYYINIGTNAFKGSKSPFYAGISTATAWNFTTTDTLAPTVNSLSPTDNATGMNQTANLVIGFNEIVQGGTGTIIIKKVSDDSTVESIAANSGLVTGSGTTTITINPSSTLTAYTDYYVTIHQNAFRDRAGNKYVGISSSATWNFTTADLTNPTVSTLSPTDNATGVSTTANLVITFSEAVQGGTGTLVVKKGSDNSVVETITASNTTYVSGSGTTITTINLSGSLALNTAYYVIINKNSFQDAYGLDYAGFTTTTTWNFTTTATDTTKPLVASFSPTDEATGISNASNLVITFDEAVQGGTGTVVIKKVSDNTTIESITTNTGLVSGSGATQITVNPATTLDVNTAYYVIINKNAFQDARGNDFLGFTTTTTWNFTTTDSQVPSVSSLSPTDNAVAVSATANLLITFDETVRAGTGSLTIKRSTGATTVETLTVSGALLSGNGSTQLTLNPATTLSGSTSYYIVWGANAFKDTSSNPAAAVTSATYWDFTTADTTAPILSATGAIVTATGAVITWTTNEAASSRVQFGPTTNYGTGGSIFDVAPRVTSHTIVFRRMFPCARYNYRVISTDASSNTTTGSNMILTTAGCTGSAPIKSQTSSTISKTVTGSLRLGTGTGILLTVPPAATAVDATFQIKRLDAPSVIATAGVPGSKNQIGAMFNMLAFSGSTSKISSFSKPLTVALEYTAEEIAAMQESSLWIYRYDDTSWNALDDCSVDTGGKTVTCTTTAFSDFSIFGDEEDDSGGTSGGTTGGSAGGSGGGGGGGRSTTLSGIAAVMRGTIGSGSGTEALHQPTITMFKDVLRSDWFAPYIIELKRLGIINGYKQDGGELKKMYGPAQPVTYGEFAKMLLMLSGHAKDIEESSGAHWAEPYIYEMKNLKISYYLQSGIMAGSIMPRSAVVHSILEIYGLNSTAVPVNVFGDLPEGHPARKSILLAQSLGLIDGDDGNPKRVRPDDAVNRAEAAKLLWTVHERFAPSNVAIIPIDLTAVHAAPSSDMRAVAIPMLSLRADSRMDAVVLSTLWKGQQVELIGIVHDDWAHVRLLNGKEGYVWRKYLVK